MKIDSRQLVGFAQLGLAILASAAATGLFKIDADTLAAILAIQNMLAGGHKAITGNPPANGHH